MLHVYVEEEEWEVIYRVVIDRKERAKRMRDYFLHE